MNTIVFKSSICVSRGPRPSGGIVSAHGPKLLLVPYRNVSFFWPSPTLQEFSPPTKPSRRSCPPCQTTSVRRPALWVLSLGLFLDVLWSRCVREHRLLRGFRCGAALTVFSATNPWYGCDRSLRAHRWTGAGLCFASQRTVFHFEMGRKELARPRVNTLGKTYWRFPHNLILLPGQVF